MANWAGQWNTDYGRLTLRVYGHELRGSYEQRHGTIHGAVSGDCASGVWRQSYCEPGRASWGYFELFMDEDGEFSGDWSYGNNEFWDGTWEGTK